MQIFHMPPRVCVSESASNMAVRVCVLTWHVYRQIGLSERLVSSTPGLLPGKPSVLLTT